MFKILLQIQIIISLISSNFAMAAADPHSILEQTFAFIASKNPREFKESQSKQLLLERYDFLIKKESGYSLDLVISSLADVIGNLQRVDADAPKMKESRQLLKAMYGSQKVFNFQRDKVIHVISELIKADKQNPKENFYSQILHFIYLCRYFVACCQLEVNLGYYSRFMACLLGVDYSSAKPFGNPNALMNPDTTKPLRVVKLFTEINFSSIRFQDNKNAFTKFFSESTAPTGFLNLSSNLPEGFVKLREEQFGDVKELQVSSSNPNISELSKLPPYNNKDHYYPLGTPKEILAHEIDERKMTAIWPIYNYGFIGIQLVPMNPSGFMVFHAAVDDILFLIKQATRVYSELRANQSLEEKINIIAKIAWMQEHGVQIERGGGAVGEILADSLLLSMETGHRLKRTVDLWLESILNNQKDFSTLFKSKYTTHASQD